MATIITKNSQTASAVPSAASLSVGELAVNTADGKLYTEHTGGVVKEIIPSTVVDGGITAAKIATNAVTSDKINASAVTEAKIADGAVTTNKLSSTGVTAGTYTTATVTVDAKGRITSASSGSGGGVTSLNGQTGAITNTSLYAIGSYILGRPANGNYYSPNDTVSGSILYSCSGSCWYSGGSTWGNPYDGTEGGQGGQTLVNTGTWRAMTVCLPKPSYNYPGIWVRIS